MAVMDSARALKIELEFAREISAGFYKYPENMETKKDKAAYEAMQAVARYRGLLMIEEAGRQQDPDCGHDVCPVCGAHLDRDEKCDCTAGRGG